MPFSEIVGFGFLTPRFLLIRKVAGNGIQLPNVDADKVSALLFRI
jgi:hypothetical protein